MFATFGEEPLPPGNDQGIEGVLGTLEGVTNITNGIMNVIQPSSPGSIVHGLGQFAGGIVASAIAPSSATAAATAGRHERIVHGARASAPGATTSAAASGQSQSVVSRYE